MGSQEEDDLYALGVCTDNPPSDPGECQTVTAAQVAVEKRLREMAARIRATCPRCGSNEREQKFRCVICADCRLVLEDQSPPTYSAVEREGGGFDVV